MIAPCAGNHRGTALFRAARRMRTAIRALDFEAAEAAHGQFREILDRARSAAPLNESERRWGSAAERLLVRCQLEVARAQENVLDELKAVDRGRASAARYLRG